MKIGELKTRLYDIIDKTEDDEILKAAYYLFTRKKVLGYEPDGTPITREQMLKEIRESEEAINRGKYYSQEEIERQSKHW